MLPPRLSAPLLALAGGLVLLAPNAPYWLALSGFVGLVLFSEALERAPSVRQAAWTGLVFGTAANATALFSLLELFGVRAHMGWALACPVALLVWLLQAVAFAVAGALSHLAERRAWPGWLCRPLALTCALGFTPQLFPWHIANTQVGVLPFVQLAELGGVSLVGLFLLFAAMPWPALARAQARLRLSALVIAATALPLAYGAVRIPQVEAARNAAPSLRIGVAQSNVGFDEKQDKDSARANLQGLRALTRMLEGAGAELTLWGETSYPYRLARGYVRAPEDVRRVLGDGVHGPVLLGLETYARSHDEFFAYNTAWLVQRDGNFGDRVDKARLIPFGETIPFWDHLPDFRTRYASRGFSAGKPGIVRLDAAKLGVLICYEDVFASSARETVALGAQALVNLTNDGWFGRSREPWLHDVLARMRSIELRRDLVRAVNTGVSSFTSATGEARVQTPTYQRAHFVADVKLLASETPFARYGDWPSWCCLVALCALLLSRPAASRPRTSATPSPRD